MKLWKRFWESGRKDTILTLADQAIVSGCNFLMGILLTRMLGLDAYGTFALAWIGLQLASNLHLNFLIKPMMSFVPKFEKSQLNSYYSSTQIIQFGLVVLTLIIGSLFLLISDSWLPDLNLGLLFPMLPLAIAAYLQQDFYRRCFFIRSRMLFALIGDLIAYGGMIIGVGVLWYVDQLNVFYAYGVVFVSFGISAVLGFFLSDFRLDFRKFSTGIVNMHWKFSSWLVGTTLLQFFSSNFFIIAAGTLLGTTAVGALRLAQNLLGTTHVLFQAMENIIPVRAAQSLARDGFKGMMKYLRISSVKVGMMIVGILILMAILSPQVLHLVYGAEYESYSFLLIGYCIFYFFLFPGYPIRFVLRTMSFTQPIFWAYVASTGFSLIAAYPMVRHWDLWGVVAGLILTQVLMQLVYIIMIRGRWREWQMM